MRPRLHHLAVLLLAAPLAAQRGGPPRPAAPPRPLETPVRLVLALAIDQLRPDYLVRWESEFTGGLGRLLREGVFFTHGEQDHAITETAPGHSTMMTGRHPAHTGIVGNEFGVPDPLMPLVGAAPGTSTASLASNGASPRRLLGTTLFDWMLARDTATRVLSVSRKDRGAILPVGRARVPVYWHYLGRFVTSKWYGDSLPSWVQGWNAREPIAKLKGTEWNLFRDASTYPEPDDRPFEYGGGKHVFPYRIPDDPVSAAGSLENFPVMDSLILDMALTGVTALGLGQRAGTDFLSVSLSTTDAIGHRYGPGSRELHDHLLHLDQWLGRFLDSLTRVVPDNQLVISLTADHGVQDYPEAAGAGGRVSLSALIRDLNRWAQQRWRINLGVNEESGLLLADVAALRARGVNVDSIRRVLADTIAKIPGVRTVYTPRTMAAARPSNLDAMRWRRQIPAGTEWLVAVSIDPGYMFGSSRTSTTHGTTNQLDVQVPILFRVPGQPGRKVDRTVRTVDIAPTLAALIGVRPTEPVDGVPLPELFRRP